MGLVQNYDFRGSKYIYIGGYLEFFWRGSNDTPPSPNRPYLTHVWASSLWASKFHSSQQWPFRQWCLFDQKEKDSDAFCDRSLLAVCAFFILSKDVPLYMSSYLFLAPIVFVDLSQRIFCYSFEGGYVVGGCLDNLVSPVDCYFCWTIFAPFSTPSQHLNLTEAKRQAKPSLLVSHNF